MIYKPWYVRICKVPDDDEDYFSKNILTGQYYRDYNDHYGTIYSEKVGHDTLEKYNVPLSKNEILRSTKNFEEGLRKNNKIQNKKEKLHFEENYQRPKELLTDKIINNETKKKMKKSNSLRYTIFEYILWVIGILLLYKIAKVIITYLPQIIEKYLQTLI